MSRLPSRHYIENLRNINTDDYKRFSWCGKHFLAKPSDVYDGDTFTATWLVNGDVVKQRCRCLGYNSPEIHPRLNVENRENVMALAELAKKRMEELLDQDEFIVVECFKDDAFGRMLTVVYNKTNGSKSLNQIMLDEGHGCVFVSKDKKDPKLSDASPYMEMIATCPLK